MARGRAISLLSQGRATPPSHTMTATALRAPRNNWPEGGPSPCSPKEVGRPRPTRSQSPRSARHETNGPRASHLPALPRRWDAPVPHDHSHRAPRATKQMARGRAISLLPQRGGTPPSHTITCSPQGRGTPSSHTITATALRAPLNQWPEGGPSPCSPKEVGRPRPTRSQPPRFARHDARSGIHVLQLVHLVAKQSGRVGPVGRLQAFPDLLAAPLQAGIVNPVRLVSIKTLCNPLKL
jgi:hypothetical protein